MELDDYKDDWKKFTSETEVLRDDRLVTRIGDYKRSRSGLRTAILWELLAVVVIYVFFFVVVAALGGGIQSYMYKMVIVATLGGAPPVYRLYKSRRWVNSIDYTKDIRSNLEGFLIYFKDTLRLYRWCSYGTLGLSALVFFTDREFLGHHWLVQLAVVLYLICFSLLVGPYINRVYGRRITGMEAFLKG